jgi:putative FmdB family regulatory protein
MPTYDFRCGGCRKKYSLTMSISERDRKRTIRCPKCGSSKAEPVFSSFFAKTSRKS